MGRLLTSFLLAGLVAAGAWAQGGFGRFGYANWPPAPGFTVDATGFRSSSQGSDTFRFRVELPRFRVVEISERSATYAGPRLAGCPERFRVNLRSPGFEMFVPLGLDFRLSSLQAPLLSWGEGSVAEGVPTPHANWILVSFRDRQPPVLFVFRDGPGALVVTGSPGNWRLRTYDHYEGWVRVCLPRGHRDQRIADVTALGELVQEVQEHEELWTAPTPQLTGVDLRADDSGVTAIWNFDREGALLSPSAILAKAGGYPLSILSGVTVTGGDLEDGPTAFSRERRIVIRFPNRRLQPGRALTMGVPRELPPTEAEPTDIGAVSVLALANLGAWSERPLRARTQSVLDGFLQATPVVPEPHTQQRVPFAADGAGIDLAAAHALLMQSGMLARGEEGSPNSLFTSALWRMDSLTWRLWVGDEATARRAGALLAIAGSMSSEPEKRWLSAKLQAGLAAHRALETYRERRGFATPVAAQVEPMLGIRRALFGLEPEVPSPFVQSLAGPVRVLAGPPMHVTVAGDGLRLVWDHREGDSATLTLLADSAVELFPRVNLSSIRAQQSGGVVTVRYEPRSPGRVEALIRLAPSTGLPSALPPPRYSESR